MIRPNRTAFRRSSNYWAAWLSELAAPALRAVERVKRRSAPTQPSSWQQGVLLGAGHIGDVLYNTASLPALAKAFPDCRWHYAAASPAADVLAGNPHLAGVIAPATLPAFVKEFDAAICYDSSMAWRHLLTAWRLGIPNRVGYVHKGFSSLVTLPVAIRPRQSYPAHFRSLVSQLTGRDADWPLRPMVYPSPEDEAEAERFHRSLALDVSRPLLACFFVSRQASGVWPSENFARSLQLVHEKIACESMLFGATQDGDLLRKLVAQFQLPSRVAAGSLSLRALVCFLRRCRAAFCTDSGPRHLANAAGIPVCFISNVAVGRIETGCYVETESDLALNGEFVPASEEPPVFAAIDPVRVADSVVAALH
jgi:ADP-heptose:LPS heptosyltransferase